MQGIGGTLRARDGLVRAVEQLAGAVVPASALETLVLPSRVSGYSPALLDELTSTGEVLWRGHGSLPGDDGWVSLHLGDTAHLTLAPPDEGELTDTQQAILDALAGGGAYFFRTLSDAVQSTDDEALLGDLWSLVWSGRVSGDTLTPLRALLSGGRTAHRRSRPGPRSSRYAGRRGSLGTLSGQRGPGRPALPSRGGPPTGAGRWSLVPEAEPDPTVRSYAAAEVLLDRYGVVTRGSVVAEGVPGGFAGVYRVLAAAEESGRVRRGYFVESLGAAQFAGVGAVDRLRAGARPLGSADPEQTPPAAVVLAACDPANTYGAALPGRPGPTPTRATAGRATSRAARRGRSSSSSTAPWCSTSSVAGAPCSRGRRTPACCRARPTRSPSRSERARSAGSPSRRPTAAPCSGPTIRSHTRWPGPGSMRPRAVCGCGGERSVADVRARLRRCATMADCGGERRGEVTRPRPAMPEGDTVWRTAHRLHQALAGEQVARWDLRWGDLATSDLAGSTTLEVVSRGKHILHRLDAGLTLHSHLRMEGQWRVDNTASPTPRAASNPQIRALVGTARWTAIGLRLGMLDLVPTSDEPTLVGHLGPDVLGDDWDPAVAVANLRASGMSVGEALLDQRNLAGVGTLWACESLFLERIGPWTPVDEVDEAATIALVARAHRLLDAARHHAVQTSTGAGGAARRAMCTHAPGARAAGAERPCGWHPSGRHPGSARCSTAPGARRSRPTDNGRTQRPLGSSGGRASPYRRG